MIKKIAIQITQRINKFFKKIKKWKLVINRDKLKRKKSKIWLKKLLLRYYIEWMNWKNKKVKFDMRERERDELKGNKVKFD